MKQMVTWKQIVDPSSPQYATIPNLIITRERKKSKNVEINIGNYNRKQKIAHACENPY